MATIVERAPAIPERSATPPSHLSLNTSSRNTPAPVPNKHLPICSPGPRPAGRPDTPPASPPSATTIIETSSLLHPPNQFPEISHDPPVYSISASTLAASLDHIASQPLPEPQKVFPWLHGLHADNQIQLAFFTARRKALRRAPKCIRGITVVKASGDLSVSKLKGAIAPDELLSYVRPSSPRSPRAFSPTEEETARFLEVDPKDGFSVRNFQIQACKLATVSDIVVYRDENTSKKDAEALASRIAKAQKAWKEKGEFVAADGEHVFNTFVVSDPFSKFETEHSDLVAIDSRGEMTGNIMDFFHRERVEMCEMSKATEISPNVFLGPTPESLTQASQTEEEFDLLIEASDLAPIPDSNALRTLAGFLNEPEHGIVQFEFPSSGSIMPPNWLHTDVDGLLETCRWIYSLTHPPPSISKVATAPAAFSNEHTHPKDSDGDSLMTSGPADIPLPKSPPPFHQPRKVLIHCSDGYTESTLLGLAYYMYAHNVPAATAWLELHRTKGRNFFAYPSDVALLTSIQPRILQESPVSGGPRGRVDSMFSSAAFGSVERLTEEPNWLQRMDGSLPSRILPYMYLGNLGHANNPELLKELGITRILSVGESINWRCEADDDGDGVPGVKGWRKEDLLHIDRVQDNGVDPLTEEFSRCLEFIGKFPPPARTPSLRQTQTNTLTTEQGKKDGTATLVHCRVGVSRSATICIAEVMNETGLSFPRAYCFVRARRLNVIIQPHLRFCYELLKWEELQRVRRGEPLRRELEWATIAREIALMNKPYSRQ
ncbi:MAG: tyrosine/serine/threonine protein phosphatase pps1 [Bogoriella megaspora]|nr:MAG: tyrosine/serine/threonine protein phosphatase pps1 [Bogoriella megaspora]